MNPFTEHACCLFKIGASQKFSKAAVSDGSLSMTQIDTSKDKLFTLVGLLLWLILGAVILLVFIPYMAYKKLVKNPS